MIPSNEMTPEQEESLKSFVGRVNRKTADLIINTLLYLMKKEKVSNPYDRIKDPGEIRRLSILVCLKIITTHQARGILTRIFYEGGLVEDIYPELLEE